MILLANLKLITNEKGESIQENQWKLKKLTLLLEHILTL